MIFIIVHLILIFTQVGQQGALSHSLDRKLRVWRRSGASRETDLNQDLNLWGHSSTSQYVYISLSPCWRLDITQMHWPLFLLSLDPQVVFSVISKKYTANFFQLLNSHQLHSFTSPCESDCFTVHSFLVQWALWEGQSNLDISIHNSISLLPSCLTLFL